MHGGFEALHTLLQTRSTKSIELADHDSKTCLMCIYQAKQAQQAAAPPQSPAQQQAQPSTTTTTTPKKPTEGGGGIKFGIPGIDTKLPQLSPSLSNVPTTSSLISNLGMSLASSISLVREKSTSLTSTLRSANTPETIIPSFINAALAKEEKKKSPRSAGSEAEEEKGPTPLFTIDDDDDDEREPHHETEIEMERKPDDSEDGEGEDNNATSTEQQPKKATEAKNEQQQQPQQQEKKESTGGGGVSMLSSISGSGSLKNLMFWNSEELGNTAGGIAKNVWDFMEGNTMKSPAEIEREQEQRRKQMELEREREIAFRRENEKEREKERQRSMERERVLETGEDNSTTNKGNDNNEETTPPKEDAPATPVLTPATPTTPTTPTPAPAKNKGFFSWFYGETAPPGQSQELTKSMEDFISTSMDSYALPSEYENYFQLDTYVQSHQNWLFFPCHKVVEEDEPREW